MKCNIQEPMHIHSLGGELREATIVERIGGNEYIAEYKESALPFFLFCEKIFDMIPPLMLDERKVSEKTAEQCDKRKHKYDLLFAPTAFFKVVMQRRHKK